MTSTSFCIKAVDWRIGRLRSYTALSFQDLFLLFFVFFFRNQSLFSRFIQVQQFLSFGGGLDFITLARASTADGGQDQEEYETSGAKFEVMHCTAS